MKLFWIFDGGGQNLFKISFFGQNLSLWAFVKNFKYFFYVHSPVWIFRVLQNLHRQISCRLVFIGKHLFLQKAHNPLIMPIILVKNLAIDQILDILDLMVHAPILKHRIKCLWVNTYLKHFLPECKTFILYFPHWRALMLFVFIILNSRYLLEKYL